LTSAIVLLKVERANVGFTILGLGIGEPLNGNKDIGVTAHLGMFLLILFALAPACQAGVSFFYMRHSHLN
jgi:hypothetical protein